MMKSLLNKTCLVLLSLPILLHSDFASAGALKGKIKGASLAGYKVVALSNTGSVLKTVTLTSNNKFALTGVTGNFSLQFIDENNQYAGEAVSICSTAMRKAGCKLKPAKLGVGFTGKNNIGVMQFSHDSSGFFKTTISNQTDLKRIKTTMTARAVNGRPKGTSSNLGRGTGTVTAYNSANSADGNGDGVPDVYANDDDGDGTIDNYDAQDGNPVRVSIASASADEVRVFSNLKLSIEDSLNANTGSVPSTTDIDSKLSNAGTLAIAVVGDADAGDTTELDGGTLNYCKLGGTGHLVNGNTPFPDDSDSDSDGLGEMVKGPTGDFQLRHGASSSEIAGGDTFFEVVTDSGSKETRVPGMLNFIFLTTPALKTLEVQGGGTYDVTYPVLPNMLGSSNNCFLVPDSGDVVLTFTAWRPQRPGNSTLGEASFVDIGKARYTIDIPNAPCSGSGGCSGNGPGNCHTEFYSTSDTNLSAATNGDGLQDAAADADANSSNTFQFTLDLTGCLGSTAFTSGQKVFLDLQAVSQYGDNAAQKFCVQRL